MTVNLRPPQQDLCDRVFSEWDNGHGVVCAVAPTGFGKTQVISYMTEQNGATCAIAHRQELIGQMSRTLAQRGIRHRIIAADKTVRQIIESHVLKFGVSYHDPQSRVAVASVQTIVNRGKELARWLPTVTLWIGDEFHHYLADNIWGKAVAMFTNPKCKGLGVTATPSRADGRGLGSHHDGVADVLIEGPCLRDTIRDGYLVDYKIYAPPSDFARDEIRTGSSGEFIAAEVRSAVSHSSLVEADGKKRVVGDIVQHYLRLAKGKLGITFVPSIEVGERVAAQFNESGVPASVISANTPDLDRVRIMRKFEQRELLQLVSVDLIGEGVDVPNVEVISMGRPTQSFGLFAQQCGRPLRLDIPAEWHKEWGSLTREERLSRIAQSAKPSAIIIDHVGNVQQHAVARHDGYDFVIDVCHREWTLDRRDKKAKSDNSDATPTRTCLNVDCFAVFERFKKACPYCGQEIPPPATRNTPEEVDGDLTELDPRVLAQLQGDVDSVFDELPDHQTAVATYQRKLVHKGAPQVGVIANTRRYSIKYDETLKDHATRQDAQRMFRPMLAQWAGERRAEGHTDDEIFRIFYLQYGVDFMAAQTLNEVDVIELMSKMMG